MSLIAHDVTGAGQALLLLHAGVADRRMWEPQLPDLAERHRVVRVDLRGFGDSPLPPEPYDHVADVVAVLDDAGLSTTSVVGASFGGLVAQELARRCPERVERLLLLCPASALLEPDQVLVDLWSREAALLEQGDLDGATALNVETWCGPEAGPEARALVATMQRRAFELQHGHDDLDASEAPGDPATIEAPTVVVSGAHDLAAFSSSAASLARTLPRGELLTLPWAGHLPSLERPGEIGRLVEDVPGR